MRILVFSTVFYPSIGGLENQTLILIKEFLKRGHEVKVITEQMQIAPLENIEIYRGPTALEMIKLFSWCNLLYMPNISLKGVWLLLLNPFKKWIVSHNGFYLDSKRDNKTKLKLLLIKLASQNITISKSVANSLKIKSAVIYNCYDDAVFKLYCNEPRIYDFVFLGRLVSQKGCELMIKACKELNQSFTLNIIGDGPEKHKLKKLIDELNLNSSIKLLGFVQGEALARLLNRHRVMIIPSIEEEGFGMVALEGMACGCKIIASDAGGLPEAVNRFGKIFSRGNQQQLSKLLHDELINKEDSNCMNKELNDYLTTHKKGHVAQQYLSLFE